MNVDRIGRPLCGRIVHNTAEIDAGIVRNGLEFWQVDRDAVSIVILFGLLGMRSRHVSPDEEIYQRIRHLILVLISIIEDILAG